MPSLPVVLLGVLLSLPVAAAPTSNREPITGRIVGVIDGDTVDLIDGSFRQTRIRLAEIDAPEKNQPFGQRAKLALSSLCFGRKATAIPTGATHRGRVIAHLQCDGTDASSSMVAEGYAWVYRQYSKSAGLLALEEDARRRHLGLWANAAPVPPWTWRKPN